MRTTINDIRALKDAGERIVMLTAYDASIAALAEAAGIRMLLVGDSLGMVVMGYDSTVPVTLDMMLHHTQAVVRGTSSALIVGDLPFMSYQVSVEQAVQNAGRMMQETGCQAVKLEGGEHMVETVRAITRIGIPVMGHLGMTPQSFNAFGGFRVQGKTARSAMQLIQDAQSLEAAGAFAIVLELIPQELASLITSAVSIPTIGIGAGLGCDGEVQVIHDILGLQPAVTPRHTRRFGEVGAAIISAVSAYAEAVRTREFPTSKNTSKLPEDVLTSLREHMGTGD